MEQLTCERLQENLKRLKLFRAMEIVEELANLSQKNGDSLLSFLDRLLEEEVAVKDKRRVDTAMKTAGLPMAKTIEDYAFSFHPHLDKRAVMELFDMTFLAQKENIIFLGPPGVGKTHLAIALAIKACYHGFKVYFTTMHTLIAKLKESQAKGKAYLNSSLVIVDEVGYLPVNSQEAYLFFQFISRRYERGAMIMTSNQPYSNWGETFGDQIIASAILDRVLHHSISISIKGESYRLKEKLKAGLLSRQTAKE